MHSTKNPEDWLRKAQEVARMGNWDQDPQTGELWWSDQTYRLFDLDPQGQKMTFESFMSFVHPDDRELVRKTTAAAIKSDQFPYKVEYRITFPNQPERHVFEEARIERDESGQATRIVGIIQDITERKHNEKLLRESEQKFRMLANNAYDWEYWINPQGEYVYIASACERITGYAPDEFISSPKLLFDMVNPSYVEMINDHYTKENNPVTPACSMEFSITTKNGEERWIKHYCYPVFDEAGRYAGRCGNNRDITERKQAETTLLEKHNQLNSIFRAAPTGIGVVVDRKIKFVNDRFIEMLGYSEEEFVGNNSRMVYSSDAEFERVGKEKYVQIQEKGTGTVETVLQKKDGTLIDVLLSSTPLNLQDLSQGVTFTALDITAKNKTESARQNLENQLHQQNKMEAVGLMAGGMAHNFNNNLAIILGNLELSKMKLAADSNVAKYIDNAKTAVLRSRDLVQQIQTYSRNIKNEKLPVLLPLIINETTNLLRSTLPSTVVMQQTHSCDVTINADSSQLQEVLINLCNNAIHAMDEKGILTLSLEVVELKQEDIPIQYACLHGGYAKISVKDTGSGMTAETREKIFDPFFTTKKVGEGTGMGLSTVQGIIDQHNGLIKVTSELGVGTTFDLYFPVIERREEERDLIVAALPSGAEKILFIDDEEQLADIWSQMLREYGYQVTTVTDSRNALELFKENPDQFDLVISDQTMPGLSGKEVLQKILNIRPEMPTILCTGYTTKINDKEARQIGIKAFCMKPLELPALLQTARQILDEGGLPS